MGLSCFKSWKYESTGHKGNRDVLASPGSYFFLSNSTGQGDEWLKSLNKGVWIPFTGVFGQRLEETVLYERRYGVRLVPLVVEQCVAFIRERGLQEVGLFRQPGRASLVKELQEAFDTGERPSFDGITDVHTVASLLKLYLRQLPEPLVPYSRYQDFLLCGRKFSSDRTLGLDLLRNLLHELPVANFNLLNFICQFLNEVQGYSSGNRMSCQNLATVFGPNILRAKGDDPQSIMGGASLVHVLMLELIREHESLFSKVPPAASVRPTGGRSPSPRNLQQPHLQPPPCLRQLSLPLITEGGASAAEAQDLGSSSAAKSELPSGQRRRLGHRYTSSHPDNCFFPAPTCSQSPQQHLDRHQIHFHQNVGGSGSSVMLQNSPSSLRTQESGAENWFEAWPGSSDSGGCLWRVLPEAASRGSSEAQEDSTPSVYDNLDRDPKMEDAENVSALEGHTEEKTPDENSPWSSCEVLPPDETGQTKDADVASKTLSLTLQPGEETTEEEDGEREEHANSPASCFSALSTGSSEVFLPSGPPEPLVSEPQPQSQDADSVLAEVQQQMDQQRAEYQARIQRLEHCNDVLERQVAMLRTRLEQQKRGQSVAQVQIRNMEQAKADADRRNTTLQREMEQFFQVYGEIRRRDERGRSKDRILQSL